MGLDYGYSILIKESSEEKVTDYLKVNADLSEDYDSTKCISIIAEIDSFILKYLEGGYDIYPHYDKSEIHPWLLDGFKAKIGCVYVYRFQLKTGFLRYLFTAATSDMSLLFRESVRIKEWFTELSKSVDSKLTYVDLEHEGHKIIFWEGKEIDIELKGDRFLSLSKTDFVSVMDLFASNLDQMKD